MSSPTPFEIGRGIGSNVGGAIRGARETSAIDEILQQANASGNEEDVQNAMNQILQRVSPERQQMAMQLLQNKQQQFARQRQVQGYQQAGLNPDLPESINRELIKQRIAQAPTQEPSQELVKNAFDRVEQILGSGVTGFSPTGLSPKGRESRAELDTLGEVFISHLIPLLNPKGTISKERFNYIKGLVPSSSDTDAKIKGKLNALRNIFAMPATEMGQEPSGQFVRMKDPSGVIRDIPADQAQAAQAAGGVLIQ